MEKLSVEQRVQGFKRFFDMSNSEGPLLGFFRETYYPLKRYRTETFLPGGELTPASIDVEAFIPQYERLFQIHEETEGDFLWGAAAFWGIPGFVMSTPGGIHGNLPLQNLVAYFDARVQTGHTPEGWQQQEGGPR